MIEFDIDSVMKSEDKRIENILSASQSFDTKIDEKGTVCPKCRRERSPSQSSCGQDMRRWESVDSTEASSYLIDQSKCNCSNRFDVHRKYDISKAKRKGQFDVSKSDLNSGKDFIAHNIRTCNSIRFKDSYINQDSSSFVHYKNSNDYIAQYRNCKLDKLERSAYQVDQTTFNEELARNLSHQLSTFTGKISMDEKPTKSVADDVLFRGKDLKLKESQQKRIQNLNFFSDCEVAQQQRRQLNKDLETCTRCGDKLKRQDFMKAISNGKKLEQKFPLRMTHEKKEDKKVQKLIKRASDHRQRLITEKPASVTNRPDVEPAFVNELQPFCQQMPIKTSIVVDKQPNTRRDDWRGHPMLTRPTFSDRIAGISEGTRKSQTAKIRRSSLENIDIFSCYGEKHRLLKEST